MSRKKVLVISYYWPPAGGPGVQRIVKFVKYLPQFGYDPVVLTVSDGEYPALDLSLEKEIPTTVKVVNTRALEFFGVFKKLTGRKPQARINTTILKADNPGWKDRIFRWIRYNFFFPDARIGWKPFAVKAGLKLIREEQPALIFCTSPPHSAQWIARALHRKTGLPWVADFRDPWTDAYWLRELPAYPRAYRKNLRMEKAVLAEADALITVSEGYQDILNKVGRRPILIRNGYDAADFRERKTPNDHFRIVYTGSLSHIQVPDNFLAALADLPDELRPLVRFDLYGAIDPSFIALARELAVDDLITFHGYVPHNEAVGHMIQADLLLLLTPKTPSKGMTPLKLYEYLATGNYILGIGDPGSEPARIVQLCAAGTYHRYEEDLPGLLQQRIQAWQHHPQPTNDKHPAVEKLERKELTGQLANLFDKVLTNR